MPATVTDSTSPNPFSPATSSSERPLAAHSSSADRLAPVTTAAAGLGALGAAASPLLPSPLRALASSCAGTVRGVTTRRRAVAATPFRCRVPPLPAMAPVAIAAGATAQRRGGVDTSFGGGAARRGRRKVT